MKPGPKARASHLKLHGVGQDLERARLLLKALSSREPFPTTSELAHQAAHRGRDSGRFEPVSKLFIDGFELQLPHMDKEVVARYNDGIRDAIHAGVDGLSVRNILISQRQGKCYLWVTFTPESAAADGRTMLRFQEI